jgi:predicted anti-sigma-YlaC factor YlaD
MNCREAQDQFFAERDGARAQRDSAAFDEHLNHCTGCQQVRSAYVAGIAHSRAEVAAVAVPDAVRAWQDVRRELRTTRTARSPAFGWLTWLGAPLAAAAALAVAIFVNPDWRARFGVDAPIVARAEYVEVPSVNATTMVFVDDKSGWLVVFASDAPRRR